MTEPRQKNITMLQFIEIIKYMLGKVNHTNKDKNRAILGAKLQTNLLARNGVNGCLVKSLKASKRGCKSPIKDTLLGPNRRWNKPMTLRSNNVKKATESKIRRHWINQVRKSISKEYLEDIFSFED